MESGKKGMIAAYERMGDCCILVWACATTKREALQIASARATAFHEDKVPQNYFLTTEATAEMLEAEITGLSLYVENIVPNRERKAYAEA
jgi:hypothetical protein